MSEEIQQRKYEKKLGHWFLWVSIVVFLLVVIGGVVRLTGSGLSIPEWPIINGSLLPPITESDWEAVYKTYHSVIEGVEVDSVYHTAYPDIIPLGKFKSMFAMEYIHRTVAAIVGVLYLIVMIKVIKNAGLRKRLSRRIWLGFVLLIIQSVMGGIVVKYDLQAEFLAIHLGLAFAFFGILFWTALELFSPPDKDKNYFNKFLGRMGWTGVVFLFVQVLSGGVVAGTQAGYSFNTWPKIGDYLIPPMSVLWRSYLPGLMNLIHNQVLVQFIHRWWAFAALIAAFYLVFYSFKYKVSSACRYGFRLITMVFTLQVILGIMTLLFKVPPALGVIHLAVGLILFANLLFVTYELKSHEVKLI